MRLTKYERKLCILVDSLYILGAFLMFFTGLVFALKYL